MTSNTDSSPILGPPSGYTRCRTLTKNVMVLPESLRPLETLKRLGARGFCQFRGDVEDAARTRQGDSCKQSAEERERISPLLLSPLVRLERLAAAPATVMLLVDLAAEARWA